MRYAIILWAVLLLGCDDALPQAKYADGTEWENVSLSPGASIPRDMREWDRWAAAQQALPHRDVKTFTPTWAGFSVDPTGDLSYIDAGAFVVLFSDVDVTGTSNSVSFDIGGLPEAIRPSSNRMLMTMARDGVDGDVFAVAVVNHNGDVSMLKSYEQDVLGSALITTNAWANTGTKGLIAGFTLMYPK